MSFTRFGLVHFAVVGVELSLDLYWLGGYGGDLFVPFADLTSGSETHEAGRHALDTIKGAGIKEPVSVNRTVCWYSISTSPYEPSCSYDPSSSCALHRCRTG